MKHFKLTLAYDGTAYGGWQLQPNAVTIQQLLETAIAKLAGKPIRVHGSGRTDAGVHARGQVVSCGFATSLPNSTLQRALNANLPPDIRVTRVQHADPKFHARFSAVGKEYRYQIDCAPQADPFCRAYAWHHPRPLNLAAMRRAARILAGRHDFRTLSANPMRPVESTVRRVTRVALKQEKNLLTIVIRADGFLYKMARSIVGALVAVGEGRVEVPDLKKLLAGKPRPAGIDTAPAHGLFLWKVFYPAK